MWCSARFVALPLGTLCLVLLLPTRAGVADDWPQWRGVQRNGISQERGLADTWPPEGPPLLWRRPTGQGFSGVTVVAGRLYTLSAEGVSRDGVLAEGGEGRELLLAYRAADGAELWRLQLDRAFADPRGSGTRSSPTVAGASIYVLTAHGTLAAVTLGGVVRWRHDLLEEHGGELPLWGFAASPLVERVGARELVIAPAGGPERGVVAYEAASGDLVWSADVGPASYSSPIATELAGVRQIVQLQGEQVVGLTLDGDVLWSHPWPVVNNINVATPLPLPLDRILLSTSYDVGSVVLEVGRHSDMAGGEPAAWSVAEVWRSRVLKNHFHGSIPMGGYLYGFDNATLKCVAAATGEERWRTRGLGKGSLVLADGRLIILGERGRLVLAEPSPERFIELASVQLLRERTWTAPTLAHGRLYVRTESEILALDLRGDS